MGNVFSSEMYKLKYNKNFFVCLLWLLLGSVGVVFMLGTTKTGDMEVLSFASALPLFLALSISNIACNDVEQNTLKNILSSGNSRGSIFVGKLFAGYMACLFYFLVDGVVAVVAATYFHGFGKDVSVGGMLTGIGLQFLLMLLYTTIYFGLSMLIQSSKTGFIVCIVVTNGSTLALSAIASSMNEAALLNFGLKPLVNNIDTLNITWRMPVNFLIVFAVGIICLAIGWKRFKSTEA